jgi:hypothetical protein
VALKQPVLRDDIGNAWRDETTPAFESLVTLAARGTSESRRQRLQSIGKKLQRLKKLQD